MNFDFEVNQNEYCSEIVAADQIDAVVKKLMTRGDPWFMVHDRSNEVTMIAPVGDVDFTSNSWKLIRFLEPIEGPVKPEYMFKVTESLTSAGVAFMPMFSHDNFFVLIPSEEFAVAEKKLRSIKVVR